MDLKDKIKTLPSSPGVYLMKDSLNNIIYVGKSRNLKNRVSSYFYNLKSHSPKVTKLVKNIRDFDYIVVDTEFEALMMECMLIKDLKPTYNKLMKSPLSYTYIRINRDYTDITISNEKIKAESYYYFGPFTSKGTVERAVEGIKEYFKIQCSGSFKNASPCFNYSLGKCIGICFDPSAKAEHQTILKNIAEFLRGNNSTLLANLKFTMEEAAEKLDFSTAAKYRDYLSAVNSLLNKEKVIGFAKENEFIAVIEYLNKDKIKFFLISGNLVIFKEKYDLTKDSISSLINSLRFITINLLKNKGIQNPSEIGKNEIDEIQIIYSYLNSNNFNCRHVIIPQKWIDNEDLINIESLLYSLLNT